jgi:hypothetical protein
MATRTKGSVAQLRWVVRRGEHTVAGRPDQALRDAAVAKPALRLTLGVGKHF